MITSEAAESLFREEVREFASTVIHPLIAKCEKEENLEECIIGELGRAGYLGLTLPIAYNGQGKNQFFSAVLLEEMGRVYSSVQCLLTVHSCLVSETVNRWGNATQKKLWLPQFATGDKIAAFALTEPGAGSDASAIQCTYQEKGAYFVVTGVKQWISFGQRADLFLVFATGSSGISAFLVERNSPGVEVIPVHGMLGLKGGMLAELRFIACMVPAENLLGKKGWGMLQIMNTALDNGRFSIACGSLGIAKACLDQSLEYVKTRNQFGQLLKEFQLIKQKIAQMVISVKAGSLLCREAAALRNAASPDAVIQTSVAKYFTSRLANSAASEAMQIFGARGFHESADVQRYYRDAKVMEIIEGSSEIQQIVIADHAIAACRSNV